MTLKKSVEQMAWEKELLPKGATAESILIYCIAFTAYHLYAEGKATKDEAQGIKLTGLTYLETLKSLARSSSEIIRELARATAPRKLLGEKDKAELLEVIIRIEGVATGLMKKYKDAIPKILRTEE